MTVDPKTDRENLWVKAAEEMEALSASNNHETLFKPTRDTAQLWT